MVLMTKMQDVEQKCCNAGELETPQHRSHFECPLSWKLNDFYQSSKTAQCESSWTNKNIMRDSTIGCTHFCTKKLAGS
jgi:hypothetical protein